MLLQALLSSVLVAFPKPGMTLPPVERSYMNGAVFSRGVTNITVQGRDVPVHRGGGWVTMVDLTEGENPIEIVAGDEVTNVVLKVEKKKPPKLGPDGKPVTAPEPVYKKIPYAADAPQPKPVHKTPGETLIVIDPGHGGASDTGAMSPHGFCEKEANLKLALDVRRALESRGYRVLMTRESDVPVPLAERAREACEKKADAFISIHHNTTACSTDPRTVRYTVVYEWNEIGRELAAPIAKRMAAALEGDIPSQGVYHANFLVTRNPQVPSCLIETDFITTPEGERAIWDPPRRRRIAEAIADGVADWQTASHGFAVKDIQDLPDISARLVRMEHEKTGAGLVWLKRDDANKTFGIAFKTPPLDDTGAAHILEHSVLCGSGKYPVKEPFVELLKSSMATFLNAVTWPDMTVYPVATRNAKDFSNLIDVYLDAVFDPRCVREDWVLDQEGWHYDVAEDGTLSRAGVVLSEMKGSFASPDALGYYRLMRLLFPDTAYAFVSGGDPDAIPLITFPRFQAFHKRYYHPSNALVFLDGDVDLESVLAQLEPYLDRHERRAVDAGIPPQKPVARKETIPYARDSEEKGTILLDGWVFSSTADRETQLVLGVLSDYFTGSNEAPLRKAILSAGLAEDVRFWADSQGQLVAAVSVRNTTPEKADACRALVRETFENAVREGLDRERLGAILDRSEFACLEFDTGSTAKGIALMNMTLERWKNGLDPADAFSFKELYAGVRAKLGTRLFEDAIEKFILENTHHAELTLVPSATLAAERAAKEARDLAAVKAGLGPGAWDALVRKAKALKARQEEPDAPEALAALPRLTVADVPREGRLTPCVESTVAGVRVVRPQVDAEGLFYVSLGFDLAGLSDEELLDVPLLCSLIGELGTAERPAAALMTAKDRTLGDFRLEAGAYPEGSRLTVRLAALDRRADEAGALVREMLLSTSFADAKAIRDVIAQVREGRERAVSRNGDSFAILRTLKGFSETGRESELLDGLTQLRHLQALEDPPDFEALAKKIFTRDRLTIVATAGATDAFLARLAGAFPEGGTEDSGLAAGAREEGSADEGFLVPGTVAYSALGAHLPPDVPRRGDHLVASRVASLDYLWDRVRVKGGAYGTGLSVSASGNIVWRSFRDPDPAGAKGSFLGTPAALRAFADSGASLAPYQVASVGRLEPYRSPKAEVDHILKHRVYGGKTPEDDQRLRGEILSATPADLKRVADELEAALPSAASCVIGPEGLVKSCSPATTSPVHCPLSTDL